MHFLLTCISALSAKTLQQAITYLEEEEHNTHTKSTRSNLECIKKVLISVMNSKQEAMKGQTCLEGDDLAAIIECSMNSIPDDFVSLRELQRVNTRLQEILCSETRTLVQAFKAMNAQFENLSQVVAKVYEQEGLKATRQPTPSRKKRPPVRVQRLPSRACPSAYRSPPGIDKATSDSDIATTSSSSNQTTPTPPCTDAKSPVASNYFRDSSSRQNALSSGWKELNIGTLNLNGLSKNSLRRKLEAATALMTREKIQVLAVQETRLSTTEAANECLNELGYNLIQHPARLTEKSRLSSGSGFIIHASISQCFSWVDLRNPHPFTTRWGKVEIPGEARPLFIGCIYLPDSSRRQIHQVEFQQCLQILRTAILGFKEEGEVVILGDFNVQVGTRGCSKSSEPFGDLPPRFGSSKITPRYGRDILQLVQDTGLQFFTGSDADPCPQTFQRVSTKRGTVSCSVIDHIIGSPQLQSTICATRTMPFDTAEIREGNFDHTLVYASFQMGRVNGPREKRRRT
jgi:exonuclease III